METQNITIDSILKDMGIIPGKPAKEPEKPTTRDKVLRGLSYVAEIIAFALLFISFIAVGISIAGVAGIVSMGSFLGLGLINSAIIATAGGISGSAIMSAAISIRKLAQDMRLAPSVKKMMRAAGIV